MRYKIISAFAFVALMGIIAIHTPDGCNAIDGKWASVHSVCYTKLCFYTGDCGGPWAGIKVKCSDVKPGETEAMLYFYFGNPISKKENHTTWIVGKPGYNVEAEIHNGKLTSLKCSERE